MMMMIGYQSTVNMQSARVNFAPEVEQTINQTIKIQQQAVHTYEHLAAACATEEMSMPGFCKFFRLCCQRQRKLVEHLINFQVTRGGKLFVPEVKPMFQFNQDLYREKIEKIVEFALEVEKRVEQAMRQLYQTAQSKQDSSTSEYCEQKLIQPQTTVIRMLTNHVNGLFVSQNAYLYDRVTMLTLAKKLRSLIAVKWGQQIAIIPCEETQKMKRILKKSRSTCGVAAFVYPF